MRARRRAHSAHVVTRREAADMDINMSRDTYLYALRLLGRLWMNEEPFPLTMPNRWIPSALHSHLHY
jgi:hypothetical protein